MLSKAMDDFSKLDGEMDSYSMETRIPFDMNPFIDCSETIIVAEKRYMSCHTHTFYLQFLAMDAPSPVD